MARKTLSGWTKAWFAAAFLAAATNAADAQFRYCTGHTELVAELGEKYQEKQFAYGTIGGAAVMEVFVASAGTWTIVVTDVTGRSCVVAAGDNWENAAVVAGDNV
jgi:hypothetical protein